MKRRLQQYHRVYTIEVKGKSDNQTDDLPFGLELADNALRAFVSALSSQFKQRSITIKHEDLKELKK